MKTALALLLSSIAPVALFGQGWAGLPFGRTAAHVRDVLSHQPPVCTVLPSGDDHDCTGIVMEPLPTEGDYTVTPQLELWLGPLNEPLHFRTLLHFFNVDRQLARVELTLDTDRYKAEGKSGVELAGYATEPVLHELFGKYGLPLTISPSCEPSEARRLLHSGAEVDCSALWKNQNQMINLFWTFHPATNAYALTVRYSSLQSGL